MKHSYMILGVVPIVLLGIYFLILFMAGKNESNQSKRLETSNPIPGLSLITASNHRKAYAYDTQEGRREIEAKNGRLGELSLNMPPVLEMVGSVHKSVCNRYKVQLQWTQVAGEKVDLYIDGDIQGSIKNSGYFWYEEKSPPSASKTYQLCPADQTQCSNKVRIDFY
ncbi:hypothetical protein KI659_10240 [Litoribacter alkaliphilus]|uniref:Uncharacterized protein n=1 Tax=Litoribacter ruber TaxID=702568 RepID=A0AAP2CID3_9BACT|nr:hypothetical protein [Litoribacter alkaliphilus]MBS9524395.1 hypothetical protein [Litoribacter alkaliphilus]